MKERSSLCLILVMMMAIGCSDPPLEITKGPSIDGLFVKIVGGRITTERPEVGAISVGGAGCTATLVASDVAITAAHCVDYGTRLNQGQYGQFTIETRADVQSFTVTRYISYGEGLGRNDIALLQLGSAVPTSLAVPAPIATQAPPAGSALTVYGYGCTNRAANSDWQKRRASFSQGSRSSYLCPGDSGGPVFDETTGSILRINSGYVLDSAGNDIYGDIPANSNRLIQGIGSLSASAAPPGAGNGGQMNGDPTVGLSTVCGFHVPAKRYWGCNPDGVSRSRCRKGHGPETEACSAGCEVIAGEDTARCNIRVSQPRCGIQYESFIDWTCTADQQHMLRCNDGLVEVHRCGRSCRAGQPMDREICLGG